MPQSTQMTHTERVKAVLTGQPVDRIPFLGWGPHANLVDRHVGDFTKHIISYQNQHDFDLIKVMPNGLYQTEDFGQIIEPSQNSADQGYKKSIKYALNSLDDWRNLAKVDVHKGACGRELQVVKNVCSHFGSSIPVLPTVFGPFKTLLMMSGYGPREVYRYPSFIVEDIRSFVVQNEELFFQTMETMSNHIITLLDAYLEQGAAGFFFCPDGERTTEFSSAEYEKYFEPYTKRILESIAGKAWFTMLHVHGDDHLNMEQMVKLPVQGINWEDQSPFCPSLAQVRAMTDKVLMGGIDRNSDFFGPDRGKIKSVLHMKVHEAIRQAGSKLIVAGGCEFPAESTHRFVVWHEVMEDIAAAG
jgi:uroporphyrinogen decarboxylase